MRQPASLLQGLEQAGILAMLHAPSPHACGRSIAGSRWSPGHRDHLQHPGRCRRHRGGGAQHGDAIYLGAGTVLTAAQAHEAVEAGATFLVSPGTDEAVVAAMRGTGVAAISGALTPSEVMAALRLGVDAVKIFPASLGGPAYLKALRGPFPDVAFMPTGGVSVANISDWLAAGAVAVGAGSELCSPDAMAAGRWDEIEATAREFAAAYQSASSDRP